MAYPPFDYTARHDIRVGDSYGYRTGDGMYAQVVQDLGLVLGVDVDAARSDVLERPTDTAKRADWVDYVLTQDTELSRDETDDMSRADLIALVTKAKPEPKKTAAKTTDTKTTTDTGA
jgi:hypothetical protein